MKLDVETMLWMLCQGTGQAVKIEYCQLNAEWKLAMRGEDELIVDDTLDDVLTRACLHQMEHGNAHLYS